MASKMPAMDWTYEPVLDAYIAFKARMQFSVASWAVFPPNWAGFDTKLREILEFAGCGFLATFCL